MKQLEEALQKRYHWLMYYREIVQYLPNGLNDKYMDLYDYLIQASLFSENGISTQELMSYLHISRATLSNRLSLISEQGLLIKNASGNIRYYKLNLDKAERFHKE